MIRRLFLAPLALVALLGTTGCGYNQIQTLDERAAGAQGQIEAQLQRRADLIPNLVATVRGAAQFEERTFTEIAAARSGLVNAVQSGDPEQMANANAQMTGALGRLMVAVEAYPQLQATQAFRDLQSQLEGTENRISVARQDYNAAVNEYNAYIRRFPATLTAKVTGAKPRKYFTASAEAQAGPPQVDFGGSTPPPAAGAPAPAPAPATP